MNAIIEKFKRDRRMNGVDPDSIAGQLGAVEVWSDKQRQSVEDEAMTLRKEGKLTDAGIRDEVAKMTAVYEAEAKKRLDEVVLTHVNKAQGFLDSLSIPPIAEDKMMNARFLLSHFTELTGQGRMNAIRDAMTGNDNELALVLLHAPHRMVGITDDTRQALAEMFMEDETTANRDIARDIVSRGEHAAAALETTRQAMRSI
jgi:hypothetical protein